MCDVVPSIRQKAVLALGRLADHNNSLAKAVVKADILPKVVQSLASQNVSISSSQYVTHGSHGCSWLYALLQQ